MAVNYIPDGYHTATTYLIIKGAASALEFYRNAFNATELFRMEGPDGRIAHAEIKIGDSPIMLADEHPQMGFVGPETLGGTGSGLMLYVEDVDAAAERAIAAGAQVVKPVQDQFYGDRSGTFKDPFGHLWTLSTHKEDLTIEEIRARAESMMTAKADAA